MATSHDGLQPRIVRRTLGGVLLSALVFMGAACGSTSEETSTADSTAAPSTEIADARSESDETTGASGSGDIDACALLEGIDVEAILGTPVGEGETKDDYGIAMCDVRASEDGVRAQFALTIDPNNGPKNYQRQLDMVDDNEIVEGLGDKAFRRASTLYVLDGETLIWVNAVRDSDSSSRGPITTDELKEAVSKVLDELQS